MAFKKIKKSEVPLIKGIRVWRDKGEHNSIETHISPHSEHGFHILKNHNHLTSDEVRAAHQDLRKVEAYYKKLIKNIKGLPGKITVRANSHEQVIGQYMIGRYKIAREAGLDSFYYAGIVISHNPENLIKEGLSSLNVKNIKIQTSDPLSAHRLDVKAMTELISGLYYLFLNAMNIGNAPKNFEILVKDKLNIIIFDERLIAHLFKNFVSVACALVEATLPLLEAREKVGEEDPEYLNLLVKLSEAGKKLERANRASNTFGLGMAYHMTRATEYRPTKLIAAESVVDKSTRVKMGGDSPLVQSAIAAKELISGSTYLASADELESLIRADLILSFSRSIHYGLYYCLADLQKHVVGGQKINHKQVGYVILNMLRYLKAAGVPNYKIEEVFDSAFSVYENQKNIENLEGESKALKTFLNKVAIPIDIAGINSGPYDKEIAGRLNTLGKLLASKHGVTYASSPGNTAVEAMRRAEDIDDVMLDITEAVQDCFDIVNSAE
jgi:hypothetical protein